MRGKVIAKFSSDFNLPIRTKKIPIQQVLDYLLKNDTTEYGEVFSSRYNFSKEDFDTVLMNNLDEDSLQKIDLIKENLNSIYHRNRQQLTYVLPLLRKIINDFPKYINFTSAEPIIITDDYDILLPDFQNMKLEFSHLTKAVYILFCRYPEGINIKELKQYENELSSIYLKISTQLDYDTLMTSIKELVSTESNAVYTHISRVKSTLRKIMDTHIADNYIIMSEKFGSDFKYIPILYRKNSIDSEQL